MERLTVKAILSSCTCADCEAGLAKMVTFVFRDKHGARALTIDISINLRDGNTFLIGTDTPDGNYESITVPLPYAASDIFSALVAQKLEGDG